MSLLVVRDKSTHEELDRLPQDDAVSTKDAIGRSAHAFRTSPWRLDARLRQSVLLAWADAMEEHAAELADILVSESGKVRRECQREVDLCVDALRFNAGITRVIAGSAHELSDGTAGHLVRQAIGPAAFIVPWNWPLFLLFRDLAPALAAGVTGVVKPAPLTPLATTRALELLPDTAPTDLVQAVYGDAEVGQALACDARIRVVAFTGSTKVGRSVATSAAAHFARPVLELGGKGASVIHDDADLEEAVTTCLQFAFISSGQMCMANSRLLVQRTVYQQVLDMVCDRVSALRAGSPRDESSHLGPLISSDQASRVGEYVDLARTEGSLLLGGTTPEGLGLPGAFLSPAVVSGEQIHRRLRTEEIFGPVLTVEPFETDDDGLVLANATDYGLAASVWTRDITRAWRASRALEFGTVWVNGYNRLFAEVPSGGSKDSGMGRTRGLEGINEFCELKHVNWNFA